MAFKFIILILTFFFSQPLLSQVGYHLPWGKNSDLISQKSSYKSPPKTTSILGTLSEKSIAFHQQRISPLSGPRSHFRPTSSMYMLLSIRRYGFARGYIRGCDRLLRENNDPWLYRTIKINNIHYKWDPTYD